MYEKNQIVTRHNLAKILWRSRSQLHRHPRWCVVAAAAALVEVLAVADVTPLLLLADLVIDHRFDHEW